MTAVAFSGILGFGLGFGGCGLVNIAAELATNKTAKRKTAVQTKRQRVKNYNSCNTTLSNYNKITKHHKIVN